MLRKSLHIIIQLIIVSTLTTTKAAAAEIWVSLSGSDKNTGTKDKPMASVEMALRMARELRRLNDPSIIGGIHIKVEKGIYQFAEPLFIRPEDSGTESSPTIIENAGNENPVFSGGVNIKGWKKLVAPVNGLPTQARGKVWVANVPQTGVGIFNFRQLWINNVKAVRAKDTKGNNMNRILSWDHQNRSCWIPVNSKSAFANVEGMEMLIQQWWAIAILRIKSATVKGDSALLTFWDPESRIQSEHPWPAPWISKKTGNSAFNLTNSMAFLDEPGEWFLDLKAGKVYYWPRANENMATASVVAPFLETLVKMQGTIDNPVSYVSFKDISFKYTTWLRPSLAGHVPHQAGMYMIDAYKLKVPGTPDKKGLENQAWIGRPNAAVEVSFANHTGFEGCTFEGLASTGLDLKKGTHDDLIRGNLFKDIGGSGILVGNYSDEATETHLPYNPKDEREISTNDQIVDNLVTDVTNEDWGCVGIGAGYVRNCTIEHNEVCNVSYTGISVGWGWTKSPNAMSGNKINYNKVHHYAKHLYDVAAIYTLSSQPNSEIKYNYIDSIYHAPYPHDPNHWFYLYNDEGSSYFTVKDNWCPSQKFLQNANGPGNVWENNGPQVADAIKSNAGLENQYSYLLKDKVVDQSWPINSAPGLLKVNRQQLLLEVITKQSQEINVAAIKAVCNKYNIPVTDIFTWQNHLVIYDTLSIPANFQTDIQHACPSCKVKLYNERVYDFHRQSCNEGDRAKRWNNIILTANLVSDTTLQNQYLNYHATQFEKWPEVSTGFCNAEFQQLEVLKNGRQLMLIISIPAGKTLDELNPKTTANNPKVDEWNLLMKKYQEGIEGTKPGEVWVFLKPVQTN